MNPKSNTATKPIEVDSETDEFLEAAEGLLGALQVYNRDRDNGRKLQQQRKAGKHG